MNDIEEKMIEKTKLIKLIKKGESETVEFKENFNKDGKK